MVVAGLVADAVAVAVGVTVAVAVAVAGGGVGCGGAGALVEQGRLDEALLEGVEGGDVPGERGEAGAVGGMKVRGSVMGRLIADGSYPSVCRECCRDIAAHLRSFSDATLKTLGERRWPTAPSAILEPWGGGGGGHSRTRQAPAKLRTGAMFARPPAHHIPAGCSPR